MRDTDRCEFTGYYDDEGSRICVGDIVRRTIREPIHYIILKSSDEYTTPYSYAVINIKTKKLNDNIHRYTLENGKNIVLEERGKI